jgi:choline dehydrogenase-like flavoprotein
MTVAKPVSPTGSALAEAIRGTTTDVLRSTNPDAIVVGAGAAGGLAAALLTEAGLRVLVLDAGWRSRVLQAPFRRMSGYLVHKLADPRGLRYLPPKLVRGGRAALKRLGRLRQPIQTQCYAWETLPEAFVDDLDCPYVTPPSQPFNWIRARLLGGRMVIPGHGRQYYRLAQEDFAPIDGLSPAWPFDPGELVPWYSIVERRLQLSGAREGVPYLPDSELSFNLEPTSAEKILKESILSRWPRARPVLGRYAPPLASLDAAAATNRLLCREGAIVREIEIDDAGRVKGVIWHDLQSRSEMRARSPLVFLCASTLESTRILLLSRSSRTPTGFGSTSGVLGHYLMDHVTIKAEGIGPGLPSEAAPPEPGRCTYIPRFDLSTGRASGEHRGFGVQIYQAAAGFSRSYFTAVSFAEMLPRAENRVTLEPCLRDIFGIPILKIECSHREDETLFAKEQSNTLRELATLSNVELSRMDEIPAPPGTAIHECGTARMGANPQCSVLDAHNECWEARGLYVTDGACFPSQGSQNPTLTIMALTARACSHAMSSVGHGSVKA